MNQLDISDNTFCLFLLLSVSEQASFLFNRILPVITLKDGHDNCINDSRSAGVRTERVLDNTLV